ncbi:MAG: hypothetical protein PHR35_13135 [Kiritimatiellae bacterium]|nr:hypothetical protein [Kiritimatiellia bacterium]
MIVEPTRYRAWITIDVGLGDAMENVLEADYGLGPLRDVEDAIDTGMKALFRRNKENPWFDGLWMNEYGEVLNGALLVAAQAYCVGAMTDANTIREGRGLKPIDKLAAYHSHPILRDVYSAVELVNAAANCFKHRDEWGDNWPDNTTTRALAAFSITSASEFPLNQTIEIVTTELKYSRLSDLLSEWREGLIGTATHDGQQCGQQPPE